MSLRDSALEESSAVVDDLPIFTVGVSRRKSAMSLSAASAAALDDNVVIDWKKGSTFKVDPRRAYDEIERVNGLFGGFAPDGQLVEVSKEPNAVLHSLFDWDDSSAAQKYRLNTEKRIKRSLVAVYRSTQQVLQPQPVRVYHRARVVSSQDDKTSQRLWVSTFAMLQDPDGREQLLENARRDLQIFANKYRQLDELASILDPIDILLRKKT
jgi:hypothetical protein